MTSKTQTLVANLVDNLPTVQQGNSSLAIAILQQLLVLEGYGANLPVTGYFGQETASAVMNFQQTMGLSQDGIVGPTTWNALAQFSQAS